MGTVGERADLGNSRMEIPENEEEKNESGSPTPGSLAHVGITSPPPSQFPAGILDGMCPTKKLCSACSGDSPISGAHLGVCSKEKVKQERKKKQQRSTL